MSHVLALQETSVKVSVCGRLLDVSADSLGSVQLLRRELAGQIKLATPTSLQLADVHGRSIRTDEELAAALRAGSYPLQAKLTVVAVHEIEQKKHEAETKKEELVQLQWQIVVEQIAQFSNEVASVAAQLQAVKDECCRAVRQFEDAEELRRKQVMSSIQQETAEREASQRDMLARVERLAQMITAERSARDVAVHQLGKQSEQVQSELNTERNTRVKEQAENERSFQALRHDLDLQAHKTSDDFQKTFEHCKRAEGRLDDHENVHRHHYNRIGECEAAAEKLQRDSSNFEMALDHQRRVFDEDMKRRGDEMERRVRDGILGRENDITKLAKDLETSWQALEVRVQRGRDVAAEQSALLNEKTKVLEDRCARLEQDSKQLINTSSTKERALADGMQHAVTIVEKTEVDRKASEVLSRTLAMKVEELMERMRTAEQDLSEKAHTNQFNPHVEQFYRKFQQQEAKIKQMEQEMSARFVQEANNRESVKTNFQEGLSKCLDKLSAIPQEKGTDRAPSTDRLKTFTKMASDYVASSPRRQASTNSGVHTVPVPGMGMSMDASSRRMLNEAEETALPLAAGGFASGAQVMTSTGMVPTNLNLGQVPTNIPTNAQGIVRTLTQVGDAFDNMDKNHNGTTTRAEFESSMRRSQQVVPTQVAAQGSKVMNFPMYQLNLHGGHGVSTPQQPMQPPFPVGSLVQSPRGQPQSRPMSARGPGGASMQRLGCGSPQ